MSGAGDQDAPVRDMHDKFMRRFSVTEYDSEEEDQGFDVLSPIPETPADTIDAGDLTLSLGKFLLIFIGGSLSVALIT